MIFDEALPLPITPSCGLEYWILIVERGRRETSRSPQDSMSATSCNDQLS